MMKISLYLLFWVVLINPSVSAMDHSFEEMTFQNLIDEICYKKRRTIKNVQVKLNFVFECVEKPDTEKIEKEITKRKQKLSQEERAAANYRALGDSVRLLKATEAIKKLERKIDKLIEERDSNVFDIYGYANVKIKDDLYAVKIKGETREDFSQNRHGEIMSVALQFGSSNASQKIIKGSTTISLKPDNVLKSVKLKPARDEGFINLLDKKKESELLEKNDSEEGEADAANEADDLRNSPGVPPARYCLEFSDDSCFGLGIPEEMLDGNQASYEIWIKTKKDRKNGHFIWDGNDLPGKDREFSIISGYVSVKLKFDPQVNMISRDMIEADKWMHVVVTLTPKSIAIYLNGKFSGESKTEIPEHKKSSAIFLGRGRYGEYFTGTQFEGQVTSVRIWNRTLTAEEISNSYNAKAINLKGMIDSWNFKGGKSVSDSGKYDKELLYGDLKIVPIE